MLAGRATARDASRCMDTNDHNKVARVKILRGLAGPVPRYAVIVIYRSHSVMETNNARNKKKNLFSEKKVQSQKQKNNDDFRKVVLPD